MTVDADRSWRPLTWLPVWLVPLAGVLLVGAGYLLDQSSLDQESGSFGYAGVSLIVSVLYGAPVVVVGAVIGLVGGIGPERWRPALGWVSVVLCCLCGLGLFVVAGMAAWDGSADTVFGVAAVVIGLVLVVVPALLVRRAQARSRRVG